MEVAMRWLDAAFLHWRVTPEQAQDLLPEGLVADTFDGLGWVSAVAFRMAAPRVLGFPLSPSFAELNLRTYVRDDRAGIWFLQIDAHGPFVPLGRSQGMPYRASSMQLLPGSVVSRPRAAPPGGHGSQVFRATWHPGGPPAGEPLSRFLAERYVAFGMRRGRLVRADVEHAPWRVESATAAVTAWGSLPRCVQGRQPDLAAVSPGVDVAGRPSRVPRLGP